MQASDAKRDSNLFQRVIETLNEAQRRWLVGREALRCGRGGIQRMVETSGLSKPTILKGIRELSGKGKLVPEKTLATKEAGRLRYPALSSLAVDLPAPFETHQSPTDSSDEAIFLGAGKTAISRWRLSHLLSRARLASDL